MAGIMCYILRDVGGLSCPGKRLGKPKANVIFFVFED